MQKNISMSDTPNYQEINIHGITKSESLLDRMKDEYANKVIFKLYVTVAKAYCINVNNKTDKKAKGVKIIHSLTENDYREVVENSVTTFREINISIYTQLKNKVALSPKYVKRFVIPGALAWGHNSIPKIHSLWQHNDTEEINELTKLLGTEIDTYNISNDLLNQIYEKLLLN